MERVMARCTGSSTSKTGDGNNTRTTYTHSDGSKRDVTHRSDGGITVTDTDAKGNQKSGDGAWSPLGKDGYARVNTK